MASRIAQAYVQIVPRIDGIGSSLTKGLSSDLGKAGEEGGVGLATGVSSGFGSKIKSALLPALGAMTAAFSAVAIGNFLKEGIANATELSGGLREVVTLTGLVGPEADKAFTEFQGVVKGLSKEFGIAQSTLTNGLYNALSAGVPRENAISFLQVASQAAIGGVTDVNTAVDGLTTVINAFGLSAEDAALVSDSLFTAVKGGKTTFGELSASLFNVGPSAAAAGVSFQEVNAAIATLTAAGTPTSVATTQIRAALVGLQRPSEELDKIFQDLGYENAQLAIEAEGLGFALTAVKDASGGSNGALQKLVGSVEAVGAINVLAGTGLEKFNAELEAQANAAGATGAAFEEVDKSRVQERLTIGIENLGLAFGTVLLPAIEFVASFISETLLPAFENIIPIFQVVGEFFKEYGIVILSFVGTLGALAIVMNAVNIAMAVARTATLVWAAAQGLLNAVMAINPFVLIAILIAALVAAIVFLATKTTFFQDIWKVMTEAVSSAWQNTVDFFQKSIAAVGVFFQGLFDGIKGVFKGIANFIIGYANTIIGVIEGMVNFVIIAINFMVDALNKLKFDVPDWVPLIGGKKFGLNLSRIASVSIGRIPALADGGFVTGPTTALIGEAGPEVVIPLNRFEEMVGLDGKGDGKTINYYAAPNNSLDAEQALFQAIQRSKVVTGW
jgi:TP901 family phage tail tape measure protein